MNNNELQLTDLEQQVLEAFCEIFCDYIINQGYSIPRQFIKSKCNISDYKSLKGLIKLVRHYYAQHPEEECFLEIGYVPTDKLEETELYKAIDEKVDKEIREHFQLY